MKLVLFLPGLLDAFVNQLPNAIRGPVNAGASHILGFVQLAEGFVALLQKPRANLQVIDFRHGARVARLVQLGQFGCILALDLVLSVVFTFLDLSRFYASRIFRRKSLFL